jgi:hypothetical protein
MDDRQRAALRENRLGFVRVSRGFREYLPDEDLLLRQRMIVIAESPADEPPGDMLIYRGFSPDFAPLSLGAAAEYMALFTRRAATATAELRFLPVERP